MLVKLLIEWAVIIFISRNPNLSNVLRLQYFVFTFFIIIFIYFFAVYNCCLTMEMSLCFFVNKSTIFTCCYAWSNVENVYFLLGCVHFYWRTGETFFAFKKQGWDSGFTLALYSSEQNGVSRLWHLSSENYILTSVHLTLTIHNNHWTHI